MYFFILGGRLKKCPERLQTPIIYDFVQQFKTIVFVSPIGVIERIRISPG